jgi:ribulose-5-phosphate 4-epimerase/fuculose-1-phosphate aldolase
MIKEQENIVATAEVTDIKRQCTEEEWRLRVDLAAAYRLVVQFGWDDLIYTHLSARIPGTDDHFLINPRGMLFDEICASNLVKVDVDGNLVDDPPFEVNPAGFVIHSAIHMGRADAQCVMHLHTVDNVSVATMKDGLMPLHQTAMFLIDEVAYHDFEGPALELDERERLQKDLGDKSLLLLRNHGTLVVGPSIATTFVRVYLLERSCQIQMRMLSAGRELCQPSDEAIRRASGMLREQRMLETSEEKIWPALRRRLDRVDRSYED